MPPSASERSALVIGCGAAGLMAADLLSRAGCRVTAIDHMPSAARKLLRAGIGGLNVTHSEPLERFLERYQTDYPPLLTAIRSFGPQQLIEFLHELGVDTFVGSSGRVFPSTMKASPLLRAWKARLATQGVNWLLGHRWLGRNEQGGHRLQNTVGQHLDLHADICILALGGASWPRLGTDGHWSAHMPQACAPFAASNVGVEIELTSSWQHHRGAALKDCRVNIAGLSQRGDLLMSTYGLEGGAIYALSPALRQALAETGSATIELDLRPQLSSADLLRKLQAQASKTSLSNRWRKAGLRAVEMDLVRDHLDRALWKDDAQVVACLKALRLQVSALRPLAEAISCSGGVRASSLDENFMLKSWPGVFCAGEMLNFDAPTGGYLLTAAWASAHAAAHAALAWSAQMRAGREGL